MQNDFLTNIAKYDTYDLICPQIFDDKNQTIQRYPFWRPIFGHVVPEGEFDAKKTMTIGSGLTLSKKLIIEILSVNAFIFDEDYVFYFVDSDFFFRLSKLESVNGYCCGRILHSESSQLRYLEMPETIKLEMGYFNIIKRIKKKRNTILILFFCLKHKIKTNCSFSSLFKLFKCTLAKQHPRAIFKIKSELIPDYSNRKS